MTDMDTHGEPTAERVRELEGLPQERIPPAWLEERVVEALHTEGLLGASSRLRGRLSAGWIGAAAAAALALFASGVAVGQWNAARGAAAWLNVALDHDAAARAAAVQATGSEYVRALARLADDAGSTTAGADADPGREAAVAALFAAVTELSRVTPGDATLALVRDVLEQRLHTGVAPTQTVRQTIWF